MANNHGGAGAKFVSVNLNKSYGQSSNHSYQPYGGSYGPGGGANRARPGEHASPGGGMVVLSRNRPLQKAVPKLSVPPPLNLPSLRKEHEKIDSLGSGGGVAGGAGTGSASRPSSSGMGWTKQRTIPLQEKEVSSDTQVTERVNHNDAATKGSGIYMPPSARYGGGPGHGITAPAPQSTVPPVDKAMVLRGEDFPSLRAALPSASGSAQKQKEGFFQKQKQVFGGESSNEPKDGFHISSPAHVQSSHRIANEKGGQSQSQRSSGECIDQGQRQEDPLPLIPLNPRSDWADDERDTGHVFADRSSRDHGLPKSEIYWERDFDVPRSSILPHKPPNNPFERRGQHIGDTVKGSSSEVLKADLYQKDMNLHSREDKEINSWRNFSNDASRSVSLATSKYMPSSLGDNAHHGVVISRGPAFGRRDTGQGRQGGQQHWNKSVESTRYGTEQSNRYRDDNYQNSGTSKSLFLSGGKGLPMNDPLLNFGGEKHSFPKSERSYLEDPYHKDFRSGVYDERDPFTGNLVGVVKRKKEVAKQTDFHDPVRESFEAELERVQKMQEMERQRIIKDQERVLEQARREEEERRRLIREEEEMRRRIEEESREAAARAEQERLEAIQIAEEQKIAREEEKRRMLLEEERRKQAAKQKLLDLEARIAKRQSEVGKSDVRVNSVVHEEVPVGVKDKDASVALDLDNWEDSERMVERITTSASSDSSMMNRPFNRPQFSREGSSSFFVDRGKPVNLWRRDAFEVGSNSPFLLHDHENGDHSPRRDAAVSGRALRRKELYGGGGYITSRTSFREGMQDSSADGYPHLRDRRWNPSGDGDAYNRIRDIESDFFDNAAEKYGDVAWGQGHRSNTRSPYSDQLYPNSESDELYSYGRSRYSVRQPRVLPPPSLISVPKTSVRGEIELSAPSSSLESTARTGYYGDPEKLEQSAIVDVQPDITTQQLEKNATQRCDSQSSLSVSSAPSSPTPLSHDELDESAGCSVMPTAVEGSEILPTGCEPEVMNDKPGEVTMMAASSSVSVDEDGEWSLENDNEMQEQEEYDEDDDGYQEEDEVHEVDDQNIDLTPEFEHMHLEGNNTSDVMDNFVLGFNEGVEVRISGDELERDSRPERNNVGIPEIPVGVVEKQGSVNGVIHEHEKAIEDSVVESLNASHKTTISSLLDDPPTISCISAQHTAPSSVEMASNSCSGQSTMPTPSFVPSQANLPAKLQFGLFSGPPLIPSPVPAIQIGSIQMPLHLHPPVGSSIDNIHSSQHPLFQFGQLRNTSPVCQGIIPMTPQPISFVQQNIHLPHHYASQNSGSSLPNQSSEENSAVNMKKDDCSSPSLNNQSSGVSMLPDLSHENWSRGLTASRSAENNTTVRDLQNDLSHATDNRITSNPDTQTEEKGPDIADDGLEAQLQFAEASSRGLSGEKDLPLSKAPSSSSANRGKKIAYPVRNSGPRSSFRASETSHSGSSKFHRKPRRPIQLTEFRVRESVDRRHTSGMAASKCSGLDDKLNNVDERQMSGMETFTRSGVRRGTMPTKSLKQVVGPDGSTASLSSSQEITCENKPGRATARETLTKSSSHSGEYDMKRNISKEDVDAPLQNGIIRVFQQPGIEAPSDEDDFIEVRSKRQMLNDRREQKEKEIRSKLRVTKQPRNSHSPVQGTVVSTSSNKISVSVAVEGLVNKEVSKPLAPAAVNADDVQTEIRSQTSKSLQTGSVPVISGAGKDLGSMLMSETTSKVIDNVRTAMGGWGNTRIDQQVMPLTQTQLDEAMKPARFATTHITSIGDHSTSIREPVLPSSSVLAKEESISSSASPINSLLAGEKIQFGAVTSPTVLPPSSLVVSHGIGALGSLCPDLTQNLSKNENDCAGFFRKDKHSSESCVLLEDCEAEAEAAASAVAVAAISTDEIVGNGLGPVPVSDTKTFGGLAGDQQLGSQSKPEESLSVSLPADLSVETPISLWPSLPSPQSSSTQMLSHFPGAPLSHFPFYEINHPMMGGGPVFAFGPHDESGGTLSQSQKSTVSRSGHTGAWQHHSGMDSFYGPFISPRGGIPGVQAPPHMVVYNHYAPVGQFGQVGLSFMGATYIPSGKQPDWKHNPPSSSMGISDADMNTMNMVSGQCNPPSMPPIQHLAPGSPLLPMGSPLTMFDVPPFQTAADMSVQACWSHVPAPPLHSVPMSLPVQQQTEGVTACPQFSSHGGHPAEQSSAATPLDHISQAFPVGGDSRVSQFPDELGLVDSMGPSVSCTSTPATVNHVSSGTTIDGKTTDTIQSDSVNITNNNNGNSSQTVNSFKNHHHHHGKNLSSRQYNHSTGGGGYGYRRGGGVSQKKNSMADWSHRRMGFHGRNQSLGADKNFHSSTKMKQIYVAKQPPSSSSTVG